MILMIGAYGTYFGNDSNAPWKRRHRFKRFPELFGNVGRYEVRQVFMLLLEQVSKKHKYKAGRKQSVLRALGTATETV